jgi:hypothetical protein
MMQLNQKLFQDDILGEMFCGISHHMNQQQGVILIDFFWRLELIIDRELVKSGYKTIVDRAWKVKCVT